MSNIAIKVENLSKAYQLGEIGTGTISRDVERWFAKVRGKEDPFLKIGETNDRTSKGSSDIVWSLKDINFEIEQGDAVGIIGRNGAGKSTLLKILSRVTAPTTGKISGKGRIASLLEVGTGFHPELSGRENIFLNGAILGMRKREIRRKLDEIVDFAGVERYLDTPVKRYSSGMYVRLAFAVAAHLESEILIVDEVLAVGDAEFQKKCLGKMGEVSKREGRTVLFVSHNMGSILSICHTGVLLKHGQINYEGEATNTVQKYSELNTTHTSISLTDRIGRGNYRLETFHIINKAGKEIASIGPDEIFSLVVNIKSTSFAIKKVKVIIGIYNTFKEGILRFESKYISTEQKEVFDIACNLMEHTRLKPGLYTINVAVFSEIQLEDYIADLTQFEITEVDYNIYGIGREGLNLTKIILKNEWTLY